MKRVPFHPCLPPQYVFSVIQQPPGITCIPGDLWGGCDRHCMQPEGKLLTRILLGEDEAVGRSHEVPLGGFKGEIPCV